MLQTTQFPDNPPKVDIKSQIYAKLPTDSPSGGWNGVHAKKAAEEVLSQLSEALVSGSQESVATLFAGDDTGGVSSYWRDTLALTAHLRTFQGHQSIASALVELHQLRNITSLVLERAQVVNVTETLNWVDCGFSFMTSNPKTRCRGKFMLVPGRKGSLQYRDWKIWSMSTWMSGFEDYPEDEGLLRVPSQPLPEDNTFAVSVLIIGGGNAGLILAARLKALGVDFLVVDRNSKTGENWSHRYDNMRFHVYKSFCHPPYLPYPEDASDDLSRDELVAHIQAFSNEFDLDRRIIHSSRVTATTYDKPKQVWTAKVSDGAREREVVAKCVVLATGAGWSGANPVPDIPGRELFKGMNIHSNQFKNAKVIADGGAKSVAIVGSANTAFDVLVDCYDAGLKTTMLQRSATYVVPMTYFAHPMGLGSYDIVPMEDADAAVNGGPLAIGGPLLGVCHSLQASQEPNRYDEARERGLRVQDSLNGGDLIVNLVDRCGGHFVDMGKGMELVSTGKVKVHSGPVPAAYTADGLVLTDGTKVEADAVIWCTGLGSLDIRDSLSGILGEGAEDVAVRMEPTWGADAEGETRGLWKRLPNVENMWAFSGGTGQHRWFSKVIALQIKGILEGILPEAYRKTP